MRLSNNGKKALYIDAENADEILAFIKSKSSFQNKFKNIQELILEHNMPPRDLYDKENFERGCEHITAMKLAKGKDNPRIYCQQYSHKGKERFVIIASELLEKKKSKGLTNKEKQLIRKVAKYDYELED